MATDYIEDVSIKVKLDTSKVEASLNKLKQAFDSLNDTAQNFSESLKNTFDNVSNEAKDKSSQIKDNFIAAAKEIQNAFGKIFNNFAGYNSFAGLIKRYTFGTLEQDWYSQAVQRRTAANSRSNSIHDNISGYRGYDNLLFGSGSVGKSSGAEYIYRSNNYDREILNRTNYLPGTRRWRISKFPMPFNDEDRRVVDAYMESLTRVKYQFGTLTQELGQQFLPLLTKLLGYFADLIEKSNAFRNTLKYGFIVSQLTKLVAAFAKLSGVMGINAGAAGVAAGVGAVGAVGVGLGVGAYKAYEKYKSKKEARDNFETLGIYSGTQQVLENRNTNLSNSISYNIDTVQVKTDAKNVPTLLEDIKRTSIRDTNNVFLMNNTNFGGIY